MAIIVSIIDHMMIMTSSNKDHHKVTIGMAATDRLTFEPLPEA